MDGLLDDAAATDEPWDVISGLAFPLPFGYEESERTAVPVGSTSNPFAYRYLPVSEFTFCGAENVAPKSCELVM